MIIDFDPSARTPEANNMPSAIADDTTDVSGPYVHGGEPAEINRVEYIKTPLLMLYCNQLKSLLY